MINLKTIQNYLKDEAVYVTEHAANRMKERRITTKDITQCIRSGEIIEQYPDDFPAPSCLIYGHDASGAIMHLVASDEKDCSHIITAYYPDTIKFEEDLKTRRAK